MKKWKSSNSKITNQQFHFIYPEAPQVWGYTQHNHHIFFFKRLAYVDKKLKLLFKDLSIKRTGLNRGDLKTDQQKKIKDDKNGGNFLFKNNRLLI